MERIFLNLQFQNGDLRVTHDLRFLPTGPTKALQLTAQAVQSDGEGVEQVLASTAILIRSRPILDQQQRGEGGGQEGGATRLEFIPLPKTIFLSSTKPIGSTILRCSNGGEKHKNPPISFTGFRYGPRIQRMGVGIFCHWLPSKAETAIPCRSFHSSPFARNIPG